MDIQEQRRLLELAAKAVGFIDDATDESGAIGLHRGSDDVFYITSSDGWREWNPLTDDGDAFRLAVSLRLSVDHNHTADQQRWVSADRNGCEGCYSPVSCVEDEFDEQGRSAATRLAIVRAAAEIGESMRNE